VCGKLLEMEACTNCRFCADVCPRSLPKGREPLRSYRMQGLKRILKSRGGDFPQAFGIRELSEEEWKTYSDTVFRCTLCGTAGVCRSVSPKDLCYPSARISFILKPIQRRSTRIRENLEESHNVFAEDNSERRTGWKYMRDAPDHGYLKEKAEVVYLQDA